MIIKLQREYSQDIDRGKDENSLPPESQNKNKFNLKHALIGVGVNIPVYFGTEYALGNTLLKRGVEKDCSEYDSAVDKLKEEKRKKIKAEEEKLLESNNFKSREEFNKKLDSLKDKIEKEFEGKIDGLSKKLQNKVGRKNFLTTLASTFAGFNAGYWTMRYLDKRKENKNKEKD